MNQLILLKTSDLQGKPNPGFRRDRWALLPDDRGCFNANAVKIKGDVYPNREICEMESTFNQWTSAKLGVCFLIR